MKTKNLNNRVATYKKHLDAGDIQVAYAELVKFVMKLKTRFSKTLGDRYSCGGIFQGYMDYTYFYVLDDFNKRRKLKLGLVLNHQKMRFEIWLLGQTKDVQEKYWKMLRPTKWVNTEAIPKYSIFEYVLVDQPNFDDLESLSNEVENRFALTAASISTTLRELDKT